MNQDIDIRELLGQALDAEEPFHRDMAEGSIVRGDAARRRNRVLGVGAGVMVTAVAVVGTMVVAPSRPSAGNNTSEYMPVYESNVIEKQYDQNANLPTLLNRVLPAGVTVKWISGAAAKQAAPGEYEQNGSTFTLTGATGQAGAVFESMSASDVAKQVAAADPGAVPSLVTQAVSGGTVYVITKLSGSRAAKNAVVKSEYIFAPSAAGSPAFVMQLSGTGDRAQVSSAQFVQTVTKPGMAQVLALMDPNVPPSKATRQAFADIDAALARTIKPALPAGVTLEMRTTNLAGLFELDGPSGVAGLDFYSVGGSPDGAPKSVAFIEGSCGSSPPIVTVTCSQKNVPGGILFEQHTDYHLSPAEAAGMGMAFITNWYFWSTTSNSLVLSLAVYGSTPEQTPLTADQFLAMVRTPGIGKLVDEVYAEANQ